MDEIDSTTIDVMRDCAREICDHTIEKWWSGEYGPDGIQENIARWKRIKANIRVMAERLRNRV